MTTNFVLIAIFGSIGLTLLLASLLWRLNRPRGDGARRDGGRGGERARTVEADADDGGGGDGGGD